MPKFCAVPNCRTNRNKNQLRSVFKVPKCINRRNAWESALGNIKLNNYQHICEKHFSPGDIVRYTEHRDVEGNIYAIIPLKIPRLTKDAIPHLFTLHMDEGPIVCNKENTLPAANTENVEINVASSSILENRDDQEIETAENIINREKDILPTSILENIKEIKEEDLTQENVCNQYQSTAALNYDVNAVESRSNIFRILCDNFDLIKIPESWCFNIHAENHISFLELDMIKCSIGDETTCRYVIKRNLLVGSDMQVHISVLETPLHPEILMFPKRIQNHQELSRVLQKFSKMTVCTGIGDFNDVTLVSDKIGYIDILNNLRHIKCSILATADKCPTCKSVRKTIRLKKIRLSNSSTAKKKTNITYLGSSQLIYAWKKKMIRRSNQTRKNNSKFRAKLVKT
ncbi:uncharacterized protein LOC126834459 [Adelges cooleyi]|uniref:uncharacterized protein LOC126834459 n=1 Tax=Adelges cooleyi TaxID=133065 RepID=UPI00218035F9|nr:uncharacterized protein LOC126834459 [Adelges cooleyi]